MKRIAWAIHVLSVMVSALVFIGWAAQVKAQSEIGPLLAHDLVFTTGESAGEPSGVAFDGNRYLIVWSQFTDYSFYYADIYGQFMDTSGALSGSPFLIGHGQRNETEPEVAFNGTYYFVVWHNNVPEKISGRMVSTSGQLLGSELIIGSASNTRYSPGVASDGLNFLVIWSDNRDFTTNNGDIYGQRITVDGAGNPSLNGGNFLISPAAGHQFFPSVAFGATRYLVTWTNDNVVNGGQFDVFGALVDPDGSVSTPIAICTAAGTQGNREAGIAFGGGNFFVVFDDNRDGTDDVFGARVSETGVLLDGPASTGGIAISTNPGFGAPHRPKVAFSGTEWLVVWAGSYVQGSRVSTAGVVLDMNGIDLFVTPAYQWDPSFATDGANFLVIWNTIPSPYTGYAQLIGPVLMNSPPVANAGPDQTVNEGEQVILDASGSSDPDNDPLTYQWAQLAGPSVSLDLNDPVHPVFLAPPVPTGGATLTFELTVNDGEFSSLPQVVNITVMNVNNPPIADAGDDQTVQEGRPVTLDGSASYDPDGESLAFHWTQIAGSPVVLSDSTAMQPSFINPLTGPQGETLTFELSVNDGNDMSMDTVNIYVTNINQVPIADAGPDQTKTEGSLVTLDGSASNDPDGDVLSFAWTQLSGTTVTILDSSSPTPSFIAPAVNAGGETLTFRLIVNDSFVDSGPDNVSIVVLNVNDPPACELAQASPDSLWPPNHKLIPIKITGITDPDNNQVSITVTGVTQDEPVNGLGAGDTSPDAAQQQGGVLIRAERDGGGNGRVYRIAFTADDGAGGSCSGYATVRVPKDRNSGGVDDGQLYNSLLP